MHTFAFANKVHNFTHILPKTLVKGAKHTLTHALTHTVTHALTHTHSPNLSYIATNFSETHFELGIDLVTKDQTDQSRADQVPASQFSIEKFFKTSK